MTNHDVIEKSWDLSLYELHRTPQEAITDDTEIAVSAKSLQSELTCPICLDMLTSTMTTKECLHRFCAECIITALRSGNKECPTCRKKLVSKRSLRQDPNFDQLVAKIFPNREEYEAHQGSFLESFTRTQSQNFIMSFNDGIQAQMAHAKAANRKKNFDDVPESPHNLPIGAERRERDDDYEDSPSLPIKKKKKIRPPVGLNATADDCCAEQQGASAQEVEIVLKLHPDMINDTQQKDIVELMQDNSTRFIKTTSLAQVEHLCKYLTMRIWLDIEKKNSSLKNGGSLSHNTPPAVSGTSGPTGPSTSAAALPNESPPSAFRDLNIFIMSSSGQMVPLATSLSLMNVNEKYWKINKPMEMFYSFKSSIPSI